MQSARGQSSSGRAAKKGSSRISLLRYPPGSISGRTLHRATAAVSASPRSPNRMASLQPSTLVWCRPPIRATRIHCVGGSLSLLVPKTPHPFPQISLCCCHRAVMRQSSPLLPLLLHRSGPDTLHSVFSCPPSLPPSLLLSLSPPPLLSLPPHAPPYVTVPTSSTPHLSPHSSRRSPTSLLLSFNLSHSLVPCPPPALPAPSPSSSPHYPSLPVISHPLLLSLSLSLPICLSLSLSLDVPPSPLASPPRSLPLHLPRSLPLLLSPLPLALPLSLPSPSPRARTDCLVIECTRERATATDDEERAPAIASSGEALRVGSAVS
mmetsp:Transcript_3471/g.10660  ORF Transcript_3471/g.10660 Transcript_3471/m.10660 type:complete len:321 (+) Transcript_3471:515-1477(+)